MKLLAHSTRSNTALVQHEPDGQAFVYQFGPIDTYSSVENPEEWFVPKGWATDFPDGNDFDTIRQLRTYVINTVAGVGV
ncbi:hypothetical protein KHO65_gp090 [Mycobacterium phage Sauce]|uniref:Uncharacterized protein n=3 Tax=Bixzunavirus TaxID=680114 RepID=A0A411CC40_9CAUD|nr:hypothetical protein KHO63_gp085 [Mycobacterium phage QBert]YP_010058782.1 hypothetical protein KHO65_gp090 [Mycobacterium phage Sauce]QAY14487.1 hypothetical protein SEA_DARKO_259 [Mycobacterium phage Darko]QOP67076.1 hypothetical protein PBI_SHIFA_235 [Mycobacterium phage Shifa]QWY80820.1 hypothetical protein SEA_BANANAFENCE_257 [Mycobacterium phage BananaFence]AYR01484.1 hypothetical protein SEA_SAUCE_256 [Mycobacterium phage Sauce]QAY11424.1 hypothetical protein SEA_QBERT_251 [Mycobact